MKILGLALSAEPRFSIAEFTYPIKGPVYLDEKTKIENYKRDNKNGYITAQKLTFPPPHDEKRDILKELEEYGLKKTAK